MKNTAPDAARCPRPAAGRVAGFSLLEVLAVTLITALLFGVALDGYLDISHASQRATEHTRQLRRTTAVIDRIARDLESTFLLTRSDEETGPLDPAWNFLAVSEQSELGADRVDFVTRSRRSAPGAHSDLLRVRYFLRPSEEVEGFDLLRAATPLDAGTDGAAAPDVAMADLDESGQLLAEGVSGFGLRFVDSAGEVVPEWDASEHSAEDALPIAIDIELALLDPLADAQTLVEQEDASYPRSRIRRVVLPLRAFELQELLDPNSSANGGPGSEADAASEATDAENGDRPEADSPGSPSAPGATSGSGAAGGTGSPRHRGWRGRDRTSPRMPPFFRSRNDAP